MKSVWNNVTPSEAPVSQTKGQFKKVLLFLCSHLSLLSKPKIPRNVLSCCTTSYASLEWSEYSNLDSNIVPAKKTLVLPCTNSHRTSSGTKPWSAWGKKESVLAFKKSVLTIRVLFQSDVLLLRGMRKLLWWLIHRLRERCLDVCCLLLKWRCCQSWRVNWGVIVQVFLQTKKGMFLVKPRDLRRQRVYYTIIWKGNLLLLKRQDWLCLSPVLGLRLNACCQVVILDQSWHIFQVKSNAALPCVLPVTTKYLALPLRLPSSPLGFVCSSHLLWRPYALGAARGCTTHKR